MTELHNQVMEHQDTEQEIACGAGDSNKEDKEEFLHCDDIGTSVARLEVAQVASQNRGTAPRVAMEFQWFLHHGQ